jgi:hypothetical protein
LCYWIFPLQNPNPQKAISRIQIVPKGQRILINGLSATNLDYSPIRWDTRRKAKIILKNQVFRENGQSLLSTDQRVNIDLGSIISVLAAPEYDKSNWENGALEKPPAYENNAVLVEFTCHPAAVMTVNEEKIPVAMLKDNYESTACSAVEINEANIPVEIFVRNKINGNLVAAKLHVHGEYGEYLAPKNRHRIPNPYWFEDYSPENISGGIDGYHYSTYIDGKTAMLLPKGTVYAEVSKGFEILPQRRIFEITSATRQLVIDLDEVLPWRQRGWVTADTHVHFLSPQRRCLKARERASTS